MTEPGAQRFECERPHLSRECGARQLFSESGFERIPGCSQNYKTRIVPIRSTQRTFNYAQKDGDTVVVGVEILAGYLDTTGVNECLTAYEVEHFEYVRVYNVVGVNTRIGSAGAG